MLKKPEKTNLENSKISREEAEEAVIKLIKWAGDDPSREGLKDTPKRVVKGFEEFFSGYKKDPKEILNKTFEEINGYDDIVILQNIRIESHCEHHMLPIIGKAHIAYFPNKKVVGISKLAHITKLYSKRLQTQEKLTAQIATSIDEILQPKGTAVVIEATHQCLTTRGICKPGVIMKTSHLTGVFETNPNFRNEFFQRIANNSSRDNSNL